MKLSYKLNNKFTLIFILSLQITTPAVFAQQSLESEVKKMVIDLTQIPHGKVASIRDQKAYIDLGANYGVSKGTLFTIYNQGEPIESNGEIIGYDEEYVGVLEAEQVREKLTIASIIDLAGELREGQVVYKKTTPIKRLVISQFDNGGVVNQFTKIIQENAINQLVRRGFSIVERQQLEKLLEEQKLGYSGLLDVSSAQKIGQLLGADAMMIGSVNDTTNSVNINARLVSVSNGETLAANAFTLPKTQEVDAMLSNNIVTINNTNSTSKSTKKSNQTKSKGDKLTSADVIGISFDLKECNQIDKNLSCEISLKSLEDDTQLEVFFSKYGKPPSNLIDAEGKSYRSSSATFANCGLKYDDYYGICGGALIQGISTKLNVVFSDTENLVLPLQLLHLRIRQDDTAYSVHFKN